MSLIKYKILIKKITLLIQLNKLQETKLNKLLRILLNLINLLHFVKKKNKCLKQKKVKF